MNKKKADTFVDLDECNKHYYEFHLNEAIKINDKTSIAQNLRGLSSGQEDNIPISKELLNKLADYLDPAIKKPFYKEGPKPKKKRSWASGANMIIDYRFLCGNRELARLIYNIDSEAFLLVEDSELFDDDGNFAPQWKYPHAKRKREQIELPSKDKIKDLVCKMYQINPRAFDDILANHNQKRFGINF